MFWGVILSVARHHGEAADPVLLEWIKATLDQILNLGPWTLVALLGSLILLMPLGLVVFYLFQQRRSS